MDKNVKDPVDRWSKSVNAELDKNIKPGLERVGTQARYAATATFSPMVNGINYVVHGIPKDVVAGKKEFFEPGSLDHQNFFTGIGMLQGALQDRYAHDSSTNTDGSLNTNLQTVPGFISDVGRNMIRNMMFDSDYQGTTNVPFIGEVNNSTLANLSALPATAYMDIAGLCPSLDMTLYRSAANLKNIPVSLMTKQQKVLRYKQISAEQAKLFREFQSTSKLRSEYDAYVKTVANGKPMSFNQWYNVRQPQRWQEYVNENLKLSAQIEELFPALKYRTASGTVSNWDAFLNENFNMPADRRIKLFKQFAQAYPYLSRALMRTNKGGHINSWDEQVDSAICDLTGDAIGTGIEYAVPFYGAKLVGLYNPRIGALMSEAAPAVTKGWGYYSTAANQVDAFTDAMGYESAPKFNPLQQFNIRGAQKLLKAIDEIPGDIKESGETSFAVPGRPYGFYPNSEIVQ